MAEAGRRPVRLAVRTIVAALALLGALRLIGSNLPSGNPGMTADPCPRPDISLGKSALLVLRVLGGNSPYRDDWLFLCSHHADNMARLAGKQRTDTVFLGDSMSTNWQQARPDLFGDAAAVRSIDGQTSAQLFGRFPSDVIALKPRAVHILVGTNDVAGVAGPSSLAFYQGNLRAMVDLAQANGMAVVIGTIPPLDEPEGSKVREINAWLRQFAAERGLTLVDYYAALVDGQGRLKREFREDEIHVNAAAYQVMTPMMQAALKAARMPASQ